ncbi:MAG: TonB-dependent receptor domain-containing protein, partial [Longimicrobiales bacterium]
SCALAFLALGATAARAQSGSIVGRVTSADGGNAIASALATAETADGRTIGSAVTDGDGRYLMTGVPAGTYTVVISAVGFADATTPAVAVSAGSSVTVDATLAVQAFDLDPIQASVGRGMVEKAVDAPAHVEVLGEQAIDMRPTVTPADHLRGMVGVDIVTQGIQSTNVVLRGFNNIFSGSLHALTDNRIAGVPSLRVNVLHFTPATNADIERMEVVLGPGAALYGPNTADGVLHMITKSPLAEPGTSITLAGGEQSFVEATGRTAIRASDEFGFKVSGAYMQAEEWEFIDPVEAQEIENYRTGPNAAAFRQQLILASGITPDQADTRIARIGNRDFDVNRWSLEGRADWAPRPGVSTIFNVGTTNAGSGIELTGLGAAQVEDWQYTYYQARANWNRLFVQGYLNASNAGETFLLRNGAPIQDESKLWVGQVQHGFRLGNQHNFTYGADYLHTVPETNGTINGIYEDDDETTEIGGYLQWQWQLLPKLEAVFAGRVDDHSALPDPIFSPRAALVFKPTENQAFRATFNRAFSTPSSLNQFLDLGSAAPDPTLARLGYSVRVQGTGREGFQIRQEDGSFLMRSPFFATDPSQLLPANAPAFWQGVVSVVQAGAAAQGQPLPEPLVAYLRSLQPEIAATIGTGFFDPATAARGNLSALDLDRIDPIRESTTTSIEGGYRGVIGNRLLLAADLWWARKENLVTPLTVVTPLVTHDGDQLVPYLVPRLMAVGLTQEQATALAINLASVPVGVISSEDVNANGPQLLTTYYNVEDELDYYGADLTATYLFTDALSLGGTFSLVNDNVFETTRGENITLNAPKTKGSVTGTYRNLDMGLSTELRVRFNDDFPVRSGVYNATACIEPDVPGTEDCVDSFTLLDLTASYEIPTFRGAAVQLSITNLLDEEYRSFPGVPNVGRLAILRLRYAFGH